MDKTLMLAAAAAAGIIIVVAVVFVQTPGTGPQAPIAHSACLTRAINEIYPKIIDARAGPTTSTGALCLDMGDKLLADDLRSLAGIQVSFVCRGAEVCKDKSPLDVSSGIVDAVSPAMFRGRASCVETSCEVEILDVGGQPPQPPQPPVLPPINGSANTSIYDGTYTGTFYYEYEEEVVTVDEYGGKDHTFTGRMLEGSFTLTLTLKTRALSGLPGYPGYMANLYITRVVSSEPAFGTGPGGVAPLPYPLSYAEDMRLDLPVPANETVGNMMIGFPGEVYLDMLVTSATPDATHLYGSQGSWSSDVFLGFEDGRELMETKGWELTKVS